MNRILAAIEDEARYILRTTTMDLDAFLALKGQARAARWQQLDRSGKWQLVALMLERTEGDWTTEGVEFWIEHYDAKYAQEPAAAQEPAEPKAVVEAALERMAEENAAHARTSRLAGEKSDAAYFQRAATSYTNALIQYRAGVRPERLESGAWLLPSRRATEAPHIVSMDGDWTCSCKAAASMHWPIALIVGLEIAGEDMQRFDDPRPVAPARAERRSRFLEAA